MTKGYSEGEKLSAIIDHNPLILMVMSRFGISLGFGDKTVMEVCKEQEIDCATFLAVANFISFGECQTDNVSVGSLIEYLDKAHAYFLDFCLPMIRRKLIEATNSTTRDELSLLILKYYDEYVEEVRRHMEYESNNVFVYVRNLIAGSNDDRFNIDVFAAQHHSIHDRLKELKDIIVRYLPQKDSNLLNVVLFDIINCEQDMLTHCRAEDMIFVPAVRKLERELHKTPDEVKESKRNIPAPKTDEISDRERDIIKCVAQGLSNKEIADRLFISINTVTTHRRNIAQKLEIHSAAGLTIYAVINGILKIEDLKHTLESQTHQ